jgi:casein kinase 1
MSSSSSNVVGVHYRVGKKIGEGSFGVIFEGTNLLNNQQVAIKFVRASFSAALYFTRTSSLLNFPCLGTAKERCSSAAG